MEFEIQSLPPLWLRAGDGEVKAYRLTFELQEGMLSEVILEPSEFARFTDLVAEAGTGDLPEKTVL